jgi:hypothetical protein
MSFASATNIASAADGTVLTANGKGGAYWGNGGNEIPAPTEVAQVLVSNTPGADPAYGWNQTITSTYPSGTDLHSNTINWDTTQISLVSDLTNVSNNTFFESTVNVLGPAIQLQSLEILVGVTKSKIVEITAESVACSNPNNVQEGGDTQIATTGWVIALLAANGIDPIYTGNYPY